MFTQGFNPHPKMSFGPSLSLGVTSAAEYLDMDIAPTFNGELTKAFNPFLPSGLEMISALPITEKIATINQLVNLAEYEVALGGQKIEQHVIDDILTRDEIPTQRRVKGRDKIVDIRPYIESIIIDKDRLQVKTCTIDNRTVRMAEILRLLFSDMVDRHHFHIHRKAQLVRSADYVVTPMEMVR
jgi:radical SAM-linked protein